MAMLITLVLSLLNQNVSLYFINVCEYVSIKKRVRERASKQNLEQDQEAFQAQMSHPKSHTL